MTKKIHHTHLLNTSYQVEENFDFPELEKVTVKVSESRFDDFNEDQNWQKNNYVEFSFSRLVNDYNKTADLADIADSDSQELYDVVTTIIYPEDMDSYEFMNTALKVDDINMLSNISYLNEAIVTGEISDDTLLAATAKAFKIITKGFDPTETVCALYKENTFFQVVDGEQKEFSKKEINSLLKSLNFITIPEEISNIEPTKNSLVAGSTLRLTLETNYGEKPTKSKRNKV